MYLRKYDTSLKKTVWYMPTKGFEYKFDEKVKGGKQDQSILRMLSLYNKDKEIYHRFSSIFHNHFMNNKLYDGFMKDLISISEKYKYDDIIIKKISDIYEKKYRSITENKKSKFDRGKNRAEKILQKLRNPPKKIINYLDFGVFKGDIAVNMSKLMNIEQLYGVDIVKQKEIDDTNIIFDYVKNNIIPHEDNKFDLITCSMVLHHIPTKDVDKILLEFYRVMSPGGILIIREHNVYQKKKDMKIVLDLLHKFYDDVWNKSNAWHNEEEHLYTNYFDYMSLEKKIFDSGFKYRNNLVFNPISKYNPFNSYFVSFCKPKNNKIGGASSAKSEYKYNSERF